MAANVTFDDYDDDDELGAFLGEKTDNAHSLQPSVLDAAASEVSVTNNDSSRAITAAVTPTVIPNPVLGGHQPQNSAVNMQKPIQVVQPTPKTGLLSIQPRNSGAPRAAVTTSSAGTAPAQPVVQQNVNIMNINLSQLSSSGNSCTSVSHPSTTTVMTAAQTQQPVAASTAPISGGEVITQPLQLSQSGSIASTSSGMVTLPAGAPAAGAFIQLQDGRIFKIQAPPQFALLNVAGGGTSGGVQQVQLAPVASNSQSQTGGLTVQMTPPQPSQQQMCQLVRVAAPGQAKIRPKPQPPSAPTYTLAQVPAAGGAVRVQLAAAPDTSQDIVNRIYQQQQQQQQMVLQQAAKQTDASSTSTAGGVAISGQRVDCSLPGARQVTLVGDKVHIVTRSGRKLIMEQQGFNIFQNIHIKLEELTRTSNPTPEVKADIEKMREIEAAVLRRYVIRSENPAGVSGEGLSAAASGVVLSALPAVSTTVQPVPTAPTAATTQPDTESLEQKAMRILRSGESNSSAPATSSTSSSKMQVGGTQDRPILIQPKAKSEPKMLVEFRINSKKYLLRLTHSQKQQLEQLLYQSTPTEQARVLQSITEQQKHGGSSRSSQSSHSSSQQQQSVQSQPPVQQAPQSVQLAPSVPVSVATNLPQPVQRIVVQQQAAPPQRPPSPVDTVTTSKVAVSDAPPTTPSAPASVPLSTVSSTSTPAATATPVTRTLTLQDISRINIHRQLALEQRQVVSRATRDAFPSHHDAVAGLMKWHVFQDREHLPEAEERLDEVEDKAAEALVARKERLSRCVAALCSRSALSGGTTSEELFLCTAAALELDKSLFLSEKERAAAKPHSFVPLLFDAAGNAIPALRPQETLQEPQQMLGPAGDGGDEDMWAVVLRERRGSGSGSESQQADGIPSKMRRISTESNKPGTSPRPPTDDDPDLAAAIASIL